MHSELINELKRHEIKTESKLQDIDYEGNRNNVDRRHEANGQAISKEFLDQIMKKIENIQSSKMYNEDVQIRKNRDNFLKQRTSAM